MGKKECIAMLLAGGQGSRLGALTRSIAKPGVSFGGKFRIIDFSLSNCANSEIDTVGVLTQYRPYQLHNYIGSGAAWNLDARDGGISILPPYATESGGSWYAGTADAIYRNLDYIAAHNPEYVLILSGDHLYRMDYRKMLEDHIAHDADLTVSYLTVPWEEAHRFGILLTDENGYITEFAEKSPNPRSNQASMGVYIFSAHVLIEALVADAANPESEHDFGKNIIPMLLADGRRLLAHHFDGFWKDVGTIASFHETNMQLLGHEPEFDLYKPGWPIMSNSPTRPPHYVGPNGQVENAIVANGSMVLGTVKHSILSTDAYVAEDAEVIDSVLLPRARVEAGARVVRAIIGEDSVVQEGAVVGTGDATKDIAVVGNMVVIEGSR